MAAAFCDTPCAITSLQLNRRGLEGHDNESHIFSVLPARQQQTLLGKACSVLFGLLAWQPPMHLEHVMMALMAVSWEMLQPMCS